MEDAGKKTDKSARRDAERPHRRFGQAIASARMNAHLGRPDVAEAAGVSYPMLANVESGRRRASDEIIERLAPVLGLRADRMREIRDALEADSIRIPTGSGVGSYLAGRRDEFIVLTDEIEPDAPEASNLKPGFSKLLVKLQNAATWDLATSPRDAEAASPRMRMTAGIIRDLGALDDTDLAKVRGYVDGLREARDRSATAVSPESPLPLIRVPDQPFGPLYEWPVADWIKATPDRLPRYEHLTRRVSEYCREAGSLGKGRSPFERGVANRMQDALTEISPTDEFWPASEEIQAAAYVGRRVAQKIATGKPGTVEPGTWLQLADLHPFRTDKSPREAATLDWAFRMALVATLLWSDVGSRLEFVNLCLDLHADDLLVIERQR